MVALPPLLSLQNPETMTYIQTSSRSYSSASTSNRKANLTLLLLVATLSNAKTLYQTKMNISLKWKLKPHKIHKINNKVSASASQAKKLH